MLMQTTIGTSAQNRRLAAQASHQTFCVDGGDTPPSSASSGRVFRSPARIVAIQPATHASPTRPMTPKGGPPVYAASLAFR